MLQKRTMYEADVKALLYQPRQFNEISANIELPPTLR